MLDSLTSRTDVEIGLRAVNLREQMDASLKARDFDGYDGLEPEFFRLCGELKRRGKLQVIKKRKDDLQFDADLAEHSKKWEGKPDCEWPRADIEAVFTLWRTSPSKKDMLAFANLFGKRYRSVSWYCRQMDWCAGKDPASWNAQRAVREIYAGDDADILADLDRRWKEASDKYAARGSQPACENGLNAGTTGPTATPAA